MAREFFQIALNGYAWERYFPNGFKLFIEYMDGPKRRSTKSSIFFGVLEWAQMAKEEILLNGIIDRDNGTFGPECITSVAIKQRHTVANV